jgi:hypothetical protein
MINRRKEFMMMANQLSQIRWGRVIGTALAVFAVSFLIVFLTVGAYAFYLAFQARSAPDQTMIQEFASRFAPWIGSITVILFTILGARWLARRVGTATQLHGLIVGILVSLVNIVFEGAGIFSLSGLITTILIIAGGWLGGRLTTPK